MPGGWPGGLKQLWMSMGEIVGWVTGEVNLGRGPQLRMLIFVCFAQGQVGLDVCAANNKILFCKSRVPASGQAAG